jgi:hypothetical protein
MQKPSEFKFSSNIYSQGRKDPRAGISVASSNNLEIALYWDTFRSENSRPSTVTHTRDHLKEMWTLPEAKKSSQSKYREVYNNSEELAQLRSDSDKTHFKQKDWLKSYFEVMHKHKKFSR